MNKKAFFYIILAGVLWGTSVLFVHILKPFGFSAAQMTSVRALVSFIAMSAYALIFNRKLFAVSCKKLLLFFAIGMSFFMTATFYYYSMQATSAATAVVLMYLAPGIVLLYSVLFFKEKLTIAKGMSVAGLFLGCLLVSGIIGGMVFDAFGIFVGVLSGLSYASYNIFTKIATNNKAEPISIVIYCFFFATIASLFVCEPRQLADTVMQNPVTILPLILLGVCTCILPYIFYTFGMKRLPAGTATAMGIVEPMTAALFGFFFGEKPGLISCIGILMILISIFFLGKSEQKA